MTARELVLQNTRGTYTNDFVDKTALAADNDREAAAWLSGLLRDGGYGEVGVRITRTAKGIDYEVHGEAGHLTYLELARSIRDGQLSLWGAA